MAESCTGGLLCHRLTNIPGSSEVLKFGLVAYSNQAKIKFLSVPKMTIKRHGAVSEATAIAMALGARRKLAADLAVSITGIAGPGGGSARKPVGLTFIAISAGRQGCCLKCFFKGNRSAIKSQATRKALRLIIKTVNG